MTGPTRKTKPAPGQMTTFWGNEVAAEVPYVGPGVEREEVRTRAGTQLDHRWTHRIEGRGRRGVTQHGLLDERQRIYQSGGELKNFVYWKRKWITLAADAWKQVQLKADWIEVIDHEKNECYRIAMKKAIRYAKTYDAGLGPRIGIPMEKWDLVTERGTYKRQGEP